MPLTEGGKSFLRSFVGYGSSRPRFTFLGPEEWSEGLLLNLETRCASFTQVYEDRDDAVLALATAYDNHGLQAEARSYRNALTPGAEPTWTFAAKLLAALRGTNNWQDEYRRLGSRASDTLLAELFFLPKPGTGCWPPTYAVEFGYPNQGRYYDGEWAKSALPGSGTSKRCDLLHAALMNGHLHSKCFIVCYGRGGRGQEFWERFDRLTEPHDEWGVIIPEKAELAVHASGARLLRLGHPSRRGITDRDIPAIIAAL